MHWGRCWPSYHIHWWIQPLIDRMPQIVQATTSIYQLCLCQNNHVVFVFFSGVRTLFTKWLYIVMKIALLFRLNSIEVHNILQLNNSTFHLIWLLLYGFLFLFLFTLNLWSEVLVVYHATYRLMNRRNNFHKHLELCEKNQQKQHQFEYHPLLLVHWICLSNWI